MNNSNKFTIQEVIELMLKDQNIVVEFPSDITKNKLAEFVNTIVASEQYKKVCTRDFYNKDNLDNEINNLYTHISIYKTGMRILPSNLLMWGTIDFYINASNTYVILDYNNINFTGIIIKNSFKFK